MEKKLLIGLINENLSTRKIADKVGKSQGTIKYWLAKYDLKTNYLVHNVKEQLDYKVCSVCNIELKIDKFYKGNNKVNRHSYCKSCLNSLTVDRQRNLKKQCIKYKGGKCIVCNYDKYDGALEFHHLIPEEKDFTIGQYKNRSFENLKSELDKCVLLCSNCHREVEGGIVLL
ncbi:MAG: hypothetical protein WC055_10025 [Melioribacteraceae bacterium]